MGNNRKITIYSDGGARGNPGPAGIGVVIKMLPVTSKNAQQLPVTISKSIGPATNNQAEYRAVIEALKWIKENLANQPNRLNPAPGAGPDGLKDLEIECFLDSELIVEQLNQRYKLKNEGLKPLFWEIRDLVMALGGKVTFKYIPREQNKEADKLVNIAIDREGKK